MRPLGMSATTWLILAHDDDDEIEGVSGVIGRESHSTQRNPTQCHVVHDRCP
jgi:hypothetical protein